MMGVARGLGALQLGTFRPRLSPFERQVSPTGKSLERTLKEFCCVLLSEECVKAEISSVCEMGPIPTTDPLGCGCPDASQLAGLIRIAHKR